MKAGRRNQGRSSCRGESCGFTLIELLVVIMVILLLLSILGPAAAQAIRLIERNASVATIRTIEAAIGAYRADFNQINPPSTGTPPGSTAGGWKGGEILVQALTGHLTNDGENGWGFRIRIPGSLYGPYGGTEKLTMSATTDRRYFVDRFGNPILYWRFDSGTYTAAHDTGPSNFDTYVKDGTGNYYRTDYLLMTKGPNQTWDAAGGGDDINNMVGN